MKVIKVVLEVIAKGAASFEPVKLSQATTFQGHMTDQQRSGEKFVKE